MDQKQPPRQFSKISVLCFQEQPFHNCPFVPRTDMNFLGGFICSSNRHEFSRRVYIMFFEQIQIFQESLSKRHVFSRRYLYLYLVIEHIQFSRRPLCVEHIGIFQEGTLSLSNRYFVNRSRWLLSMNKKINNILQWYYIDIKTGCC